MSAEVKAKDELEIAHILFIDTVGYSRLLIQEQRQLLEDLSAVVRSTDCFRTADAAGKLIRLPTGDEWLSSSRRIQRHRLDALLRSVGLRRNIRTCHCAWAFIVGQ